jgi:hypothetical protein
MTDVVGVRRSTEVKAENRDAVTFGLSATNGNIGLNTTVLENSKSKSIGGENSIKGGTGKVLSSKGNESELGNLGLEEGDGGHQNSNNSHLSITASGHVEPSASLDSINGEGRKHL